MNEENNLISNKEIIGIVILFISILVFLYPKGKVEKYIFAEKSNYSLSIDYLKSLIKIYPNNKEFYITLAKFYLKVGKLQEAYRVIKNYETRFKIDSKIMPVYATLLKNLYFKTKNKKYLQKEKILLSKILDKNPLFVYKEASAINDMKLKFLSLKKLNLPNHEDELLNLALYFKDYKLALKESQKLYFVTKNDKYLEKEAEIYTVMDDNDKASTIYLNIFTKTKKVVFFKKAVNVLLWKKEYKKAYNIMQQYENLFIRQRNLDVLRFILKNYLAIARLNEAKNLALKLQPFLYKYNEKLYTLIYKTFVYSKSLDNAYNIASIALLKTKYKNRWMKRLADVALWTNKPYIAFNLYYKLYQKTKSKKIKKIIFTFNYPKAQELKFKTYLKEVKSHNYTHLLNLAKYYVDYLGLTDKGIEVLSLERKKYLKYYITYALYNGRIDLVKKSLKDTIYLDLKDKLKIANALIINNDFEDAFYVLSYVKNMPKDKYYYKLLTYVTWRLRKFNKLIALLKYMNTHNLIDSEEFSLLMSYYYSTKNYNDIENSLRTAITKYNMPLYKQYIDILILNKKYKKALNILDKNFTPSKYYMLTKAKIYTKLKNNNKASFFYKKAIKYNLTTNEEKEILWFILDTKNYKLFKLIYPKVKNNRELSELLVNIYTNLWYIDKAYNEIKYIKIDNVNKLLLLSNIYEYKTEFDKAKFYRLKAWKLANKMLKENSNILENDKEFLKTYIQLSFFYMTHHNIEKLLKKAHKLLTKKEYTDLLISYYFQINYIGKMFYINNYKRLY